MSLLKPFKAIRPRRDLVHLVASRPIYTYKQNVLSAKLEENPYTFIHIINPEYFENEEDRTIPNSPERFEKVKAKFNEFTANDILIEDNTESLYVYRQTKNSKQYIGVIGGASILEYNLNKIKKHEATLSTREEVFTNYLEIVGFNAEPVLLAHEQNENIELQLKSIVKFRPEYEFTTTDDTKHELWIVQGKQMNALLSAFSEIEKLYIADGHHRSASSARYHQKIVESGQEISDKSNHAFFLSYLISENQLTILPFNRLVKTMNGLTKNELIDLIKKSFRVEHLEAGIEPTEMHHIHMYLAGEWFRLILVKSLSNHDVINSIDAELLTQLILSPILGITDLKNDSNIEFNSSSDRIKSIENAVDSGEFKIGFSLYPVSIEQLKAVADANAIMPPKSTWIEPKLRSGLTIYKLQD